MLLAWLLLPAGCDRPEEHWLQGYAEGEYLRLGAPVTPGTQWCSWIHIEDAVQLIIATLTHERVRGPLNLTSPNPVPAGITAPFLITASKTNPSQSSFIRLTVTNGVGLATVCDPVLPG